MSDQRISGRRGNPDTGDLPDDTKQVPDPMDIERHQPDPMLQMSAGKLGAGGFALVGVAIVILLGVVFYGLNSNGPAMSHTASGAPAARSSTPHG